MPKKLTTMTEAELDEASQAADASMAAFRGRKRAIQDERDRRAFAKLFENFSPEQRARLQMLGPDGIPTAELVGEPGS